MVKTSQFALSEDQRLTYRRYASLALPRHTSYPAALYWQNNFPSKSLSDELTALDNEHRDLSLYFHIPYCRMLCYYCACNKEIIPDAQRAKSDPSVALLQNLKMEIARFSVQLANCRVKQVHFGGGTPTFLSPEQLESLWADIISQFQIDPKAEIAMEVDPRVTTAEHLVTIRRLGFNRLSLGVQDFDPQVQQAVNRAQPYEMIVMFMEQCRKLGFDSINFDLIYGLPYQTAATMRRTVKQVVDLSPDRIAFYRLAVIPEIFKWQRTFRRTDLPEGDLPLELNLIGINAFLDAGYEFIGLDHFAKPDERLALAARDGSLRRNFQGMTTERNLPIVGIGPSAISQLENVFSQNLKEAHDWGVAVQTDFAVEKGLHLSFDDQVRKSLLEDLYGHGSIDSQKLESIFKLDFDSYFQSELENLIFLESEGLVTRAQNQISVTTPLGRLLVRVVAAVFDRYLPPQAFREGLEKHQSSRVG